jgi:hypothetical protein
LKPGLPRTSDLFCFFYWERGWTLHQEMHIKTRINPGKTL